MKHLALVLAVFLLTACQTTDTTVVSTAKPVEVAEAEPKKETPKQPKVPTVFQTAKPVICAPPKVIQKGLENNKYEKPFATWVSIIKELRVVMLVDRDRKTLTLLEYIGNGYACFLSVGKDLYITETLPLPTNGQRVKLEMEN
jgi:hypothetical protein